MTRLSERRRVQQDSEISGEGDPEDVTRALQDLDDPAMVGDIVEIGPGSYRAPGVARQLAEAVSAYRAKHDLTQDELGRTLALHQSQIARIEAGVHTPSIETLIRLTRHLHMAFSIEFSSGGASLRVSANSH